MTRQWLIAVVVGLALGGVLALVQSRGGESGGVRAQAPDPEPVEASEQPPIAFPHDTHVADYQIDCQYCHFSAERSQSAGVPAVSTCMGCHAFVSGTENPEQVAVLRGYAERGEAIPWNRVYKVHDHVQFPHMRHVSAGVDCASCHGSVEEIGVIEEVAQPLTMGWCLSCHVEMEASRDCTVCHY